MKENSFELVEEKDIAKLLKGPSAWVLKNDDLWGDDYSRFIVDDRVIFTHLKPGPKFGLAILAAIVARTKQGQEAESEAVHAFLKGEMKTWGAAQLSLQTV
jgi:hypothetical protein